MDNLKRCPFCGGEVELIIPRAWEYRAYIICKTPACLGMMKIEWCSAEESEEMLTLLVDSWNRRTPEWIPLTERVPGQSDLPCIGFHESGLVFELVSVLGGLDGVTHWLPAPEPPEVWKEGDNE